MSLDFEYIRSYCLLKTGAEESFPFDEETLVFKVGNKIFAIIPLERIPPQINLKCDPEYALELRDEYDGIIIPGYHMNKKHWNTVILEGDLEASLFFSLVDHSYDLIRKSLPKKVREELESMETPDDA